MTAEQKLEKCKELVETLRKDADAYRDFGYATVASTFNRRANELQAVLEETDEREKIEKLLEDEFEHYYSLSDDAKRIVDELQGIMEKSDDPK